LAIVVEAGCPGPACARRAGEPSDSVFHKIGLDIPVCS
jgi:hypothetical protein